MLGGMAENLHLVQGLGNRRGARREGGDSIYMYLILQFIRKCAFLSVHSPFFAVLLIWIPMLLQSVDRLWVLYWVLAGEGRASRCAPGAGAGVTWSRTGDLGSTGEEGSRGTRASGSRPSGALPASLARFLLLRNSLCRGLCDGSSAPLPERRQVVMLFRRRRFSRVSCRRSHFSS